MDTEVIDDIRTADKPDDWLISVVPPREGLPVIRLAPTDECRLLVGVTIPSTDTTVATPAIYDAVFIGFDTEWEKKPNSKLGNLILAYGLTVLCGARTVSIVVEPAGPEKKHRLSLKKLIGLAIQKAVQSEVITGWPAEIYMAVHYGRGDFAACSDSKKTMSQLTGVRGTLATQSRPMRLDAE